MVITGEELNSLSSQVLCEKLKSTGTKTLVKVAKIFEEEEIDGEDLTSLTHEELCVLLPKLGMRKKLAKFVAKMGFKLVTMADEEPSSKSSMKRKSSELQALEPCTQRKAESNVPYFVWLSDNGSPQDKIKNKGEGLEKNGKTVLDLTGDSETNETRTNKMENKIRIERGKALRPEAIKKLAHKYHVRFLQMLQTIEAADRLRRSVFISGLPCCTTREGLNTLINDLKKHIERKTKVRISEVEILVKMYKPTGRVLIKSSKWKETPEVVKALHGLFLEPEFNLFARRDAIPGLATPSLRALYKQIKPLLKKIYPTLPDSASARRLQEELTARGNVIRKPPDKITRVWQVQTRNRTSDRTPSVVVSGSRAVYEKPEVNGHHLSSTTSDTRLMSTPPVRYPRDRARPVARSQIRVQGIPDPRMSVINRHGPISDRRVPPFDRRAPAAINRKAITVDRRGQIERRQTPVEFRDQPSDRRLSGHQSSDWRSSIVISTGNKSAPREVWRTPALQLSNYDRRPHDSQSTRELQPQSFYERAPPHFREHVASQQYIEGNSRISTTRTLRRQQDAHRPSLDMDERMDQRSTRRYIERINIVPTLRGEMACDERRIPPPVPWHSISDQGQRDTELWGPIPIQGHDQEESSRGLKRRWEEAAKKNQPRGSLFLTGRTGRGRGRARF